MSEELRPQCAWVPPGKPAWHSGWMNSYGVGLADILAHLGHAVDYDTMMGDLGLAFITQGEENSINLIDGAVDVGWWPLEGLAELRLNFVEHAVGREIRDVLPPWPEPGVGGRAVYEKWFEPALRASLDRQIPALVWMCPDAYIITGCDDHAERPLIGMCPNTKAGEERVARIEEPLPPRIALIPGEARPTLDRAAADVEALRYAMALQRDQVLGVPYAGTYPLRRPEAFERYWRTGIKSLAAWIVCLKDMERPGMHYWHGNVYGNLLRNRGSAIRYLQAMRSRCNPAAGEHLSTAIAAYDQVMDTLKQCDLSQAALATREGRNALIAHIRQIMSLEPRAADALERAANAMM